MSGGRRKKRAAEGEESSERWLITYADLVTLLFALFIVLFANSNLDEGKFGKTADSIRRAFDVGLGVLGGAGSDPGIFDEGSSTFIPPTAQGELGSQLLSANLSSLSEIHGLSEQVSVQMDESHVIVSLSNNLLYASGSASVNAEAEPFLLELGAIMAGLPNEIRVEGHTDNIPATGTAFATNWELSAARATSVLRLLVERAGVGADRIHAAGFSDQRPVASNATPEGRAANRRADIVILFPEVELDPETLGNSDALAIEAEAETP